LEKTLFLLKLNGFWKEVSLDRGLCHSNKEQRNGMVN
jgi:hypothetical protein